MVARRRREAVKEVDGVPVGVKQDEEDEDKYHGKPRGGLVRRQQWTRLGFCPTRIMVVLGGAGVRWEEGNRSDVHLGFRLHSMRTCVETGSRTQVHYGETSLTQSSHTKTPSNTHTQPRKSCQSPGTCLEAAVDSAELIDMDSRLVDQGIVRVDGGMLSRAISPMDMLSSLTGTDACWFG
ncbi:hypothetical protein L1987_12252 [Smallanthus sonchifolius]|uniref:Uncharacterized protein n=1 Tax=Smallanthus sonchifolius TaxID=185202 RepID=A0ACB9JDU6_9ASTR|nr:hypothetical protein L1987_12252 [Smallanthus sonchifolius]